MAVSYGTAREAVMARLSASAFGHCERVAETSALIADRYGLDVEAARLAGLLHDWHREADRAWLLDRARETAVPVSGVDEAVPYLLHGPVAACDLADEFPGIAPEVLDAIAAHTFGSVDMAPLARAVYIADVVEPERRHPEAAILRDLIGLVTLDELFSRAYVASLQRLVAAHRPIHPVTLDVYNRRVAGVGR